MQPILKNFIVRILSMIFILAALNGCGQKRMEYTRILILNGDKALSEGHFNEAIMSYSMAILMDDKNIHCYMLRAGAYANKTNFDKALEDYKTAMSFNPGYAPFYGMIATMYYEKGDIDSALKEIEAGIRIDKNHPVLFIIRGLLFEKKGDCEKAIENYKTAMSFNPENFNTNVNIAWVLATCPDEKVRNGHEALAIMQTELEKEKNDDTYRTMAAAYAETGDFDNAVAMQEKALELLKGKKATSAWRKKDKKRDFEAYTKQLRTYKENKKWRMAVAHQ